ncbi:dynein axonemal heavy chain 8 [Echinops telfairi]|uniref:Dynein axonemal heavy chain 8 n=1 Tax=Echinops telfairi TaxID=9371 RepID=A0AC55DG46_ECHTE|nr:dynein axonemal heavy chain 8 [Echinops telfairi]
MMRLYVDNASPEGLKGLCVFFVRCRTDVPLNAKNIQEDVLFTVLDARKGLLKGIRSMLANIFLPAILATSNWGALNQSKQGEADKHIFTETIRRYLSFLEGARVSIEGTVKLKTISHVDFNKLQTFEEVTAVAGNSETVHQLEDVLMIWYKQIEQVLIESEQMRKEADDSGPLTELEHWKRMSAKFNYIIEQIKGPSCKAVINVLNVAHSKLLKNWRELDARITDTANESKDNVRYLYTLEKVCQPLYNYDLVSMAHGIQNLINAIKMIHSVSRYYNTSERMTSLFIKVTNQMVTACKAYITDGGVSHVWDQETPAVLKKIQVCITKTFMSGLVWFSVFIHKAQVDFEINTITEMITIVQTYSALSNSTIEGIDILAIKFKNIYQGVKKKQYDILDPRRTEFETDFLEFMSKISSLEVQIQAFMSSTFGKILSSQLALQLLQRFQKLNIPCLQLEINHTIERILQCYVAELEATKKLYHSQKDDPPLARNMPPIAGKILWVRQLYRRISEPINYFFQNSDILSSPEGKAIIRQYNKISYVLVEFEVVYHTAWGKEISQLQYALQATLFVRHPETGKLLVNFDPKILEVVRETKCMIKMKLDVPEQAKKLLKLESKLKADKLYLQVESVLRQGLTILTWSSLTLESFFQEVDAVLDMFNQLLKQVSDLCEMHIDTVLKEIAKTVLISLPESGATKIEDMLALNETCTKEWAEILNHKSKHVEEAVRELISIFEKIYDVKNSRKAAKESEQRKHVVFGSETEEGEGTEFDANIRSEDANDKEDEFKKECKEVFAFFTHQLLDSLQKATRLSLDTMKRRIFVSSHFGRKRSEDIISFIKSEVHLAIPNVIMVPSLDDIQQAINRMIQLTLEVSRGVAHWGQQQVRRIKSAIVSPNRTLTDVTHISTGKQAKKEDKSYEEIPARKLKNFYPGVAEHKDISKLVLLLSSSVNSLRKAALEALQDFQKYKTLWTEDRDVKVKEFLANNPSLTEIRSEILHYATFEQEIDELKPIIVVGALELHTAPMKLALSIEAKAWKMLLCRYLNEEYKKKMSDMIAFINEYLKKLSRPIRDLDDVRFAMEALSCIRDNEIQMDMTLGPIEEAYAILNRFEVEVTKEESEAVDTLRYSFNKLQSKAVSVQDELVQVQPKFKSNLLESVEVFQEDVLNFAESYDKEGPMVPGIPPQEASNRLQIFQANFDDLWRKFVTYSSGEQLFGLPVTDYEVLHKTRKELNLLQKLYGLYDTVMGNISGYYEMLWSDVDIEKINAELQEFQNRCRKLPKGLKDWQAFLDLKKRIDDFSESCPLLEMMTNKAMKQRHWDRISELTGTPFDVESDSFCLRNIMEAPLLKNKDDIEDICISAIKEKDIEAKLALVIDNWTNQNLSFAAFKGKGELLLKGTESGEIITLMEDSLMVLGSLLSNSTSCQVARQFQTTHYPSGYSLKSREAKRFQNIDKSWIKIMQRAHENPNVISCCVGDETMGQLLPHLHEQLEVCQKSLTGYLEKKRLLFPRFFFVSDPVLLEILGQASDSHTIQPHLPAVSDNINEVTFHPKEYDRIMAVISREGEKIMLDVPVMAKGPVEIWLFDLLKMQMSSLHNIIRSAYYQISDTGFQLLPFLNHFPAQVGLLGIQMLWTHDSEEALTNAKDDRKIMQMTNQKFLDILNTLIGQTTHDLSKFDRVKFETLITIHVHQRDIFDDLVKMHIKSITDFEWLKQSRFYFKEDLDQTVVSITDVDFIYQNEFLGCTDRLVITPLTDRCYITLAQALGMNMGGAPAGPAGTGKTETTKDMGRCLGKYVVVFNCSDQMDFRGLGRIFKGLAQSGSWGCFDEFNRIELPVLSVAAQQIYIVLTARKERKKQFIFSDGDCVDLNPEFGIFLTMNPGYAGRQELPENLKIQFRTVAMMVPDRQIIMRVKLASCGFLENVILAQKFYVLYKLCEEQLTKQVHYDFGLRNILSVLRTLGAQKRARPEDSELSTVMRGLRDMNLSKLVDEDEPLFLSLINDLFPGLQLDSSTYVELQAAVANQVAAEGLINHPPWNLKLVQLYETSLVRHGLMTLGPSGSGKTSVITILMKALTECGRPHREMRMNPKAITAPQMFGRLDTATNDWTDGIFSTLWRKTLKAKKGENIFLILDGPVDAIWIENLNSVLDDNKTLTLANGDRIPMAPNCKLLFEVHNIENASPATVSRMGMVYISSSALSWRPILQAWLKKRTPQETSVFLNLYDKIFEDAYTFMKLNLSPKMQLLECNYIVQSLTLLEGLIPSKEEGGVSCIEHLHKLFVFGIMWSLGALLELENREKLEAFLRSHQSKISLPEIPKDTAYTMYEFFVTDYGDWEHWNKKVLPYYYPTDSLPEYSSILVPNVDNVRTNFLIDTIAKQHKAVLLTGEQGTAKTVMIKAYLKKYDPEVQLSKSLNFSSATEPMMFQRTIESYVDKRMGSTYGPPGGRKMTVFIDDINMPVINEWGDQITNEIVRQMMEMDGMYSLDKPGDFTTIIDVQLIAAMIHPGGGRNDIPQRLKRQFTVFNCTLPSNASIDKIFGIIGCGYFDPCRHFKPEVCELIGNLVSAGRVLWQWTKVKMLPTPSKFHYIFNLRDLSRIWQGMLVIKAEECDSVATLLSLFRHECNRVIADRFITPEDEQWFSVHLTRAIEENVNSEAVSNMVHEPYFVDFLHDMPEPTGDEPEDTVFEVPKIYELVPNFEFLSEKLQQYQRQFNEIIRGASLDLVFFKDAMTHLIKISRIIRTSCGNALLVGVGGSGKQSLSRLASFIAGYQIFQITLTRSYNVSNLTEDLKSLYKVAGADGKGITFIFTDNEIKDEAFLEYLNNLLSSGEEKQYSLDKLMEASESVAKLSQELAVKEKELAVASVKADEVLAEVTVSAQASAKVKNEVQEVKDKAQKIVDEIDTEKVKAESKLEAAKPALEEAEAALNTIKPNDIATVRKLAKPPHLIMRIMDCVLLLFQKKIDPVTMDPEKPCCKPSWSESLKLMSATGFLFSLQQFPKDTINEETVELLQPYFSMDDYSFESAKKVCGNVAGLLSWTLAMATFYGINREVLPLKANLAKQEGRLSVANAELGKAQSLLDEKQAELDKVQAKFDAAMNEKMDLLNDADMCRKKMQAASALIDGLSGEKVRWTQQSKEFKAQINRLVGDILLCTGFLSYLGPFNQIFRNLLLKDLWETELRVRRIPFTENLNIISMLVDPPTIGEWGLQGLPGDDLSIQNGIIVTKATRYPLLIDPQTQGKTWIKSKEKENDLQVTSLNHKYFRTHLEDSLSLGRPLLIEDIREELDPALDNVLEKNFIKSGTTFKVKVGDKECDIMDTFKLYITTKLPNPAFTPEINAKTSVIDFTVTMKGLENQLLRRVILTEKQELESERVKLLEDVTFNKRKMKELEDNLLYKLSATKGSLVDDESLIGVLRTTKQTAAEVSEKLHVAAETEVKITTAQEEFRPAATRGSILYFLITEMSMVNIMYQTSLAQFLKLFDQSMARSEKSPLPQKRITNIIEYLTYEVFTYSVRGLYENHKFLFVLLMTLKIDLQRGTVKHREFQALIKGGAALDLKACPPKPFRWILDMTWLNLVELSKLPQFAEIMNQISRNEKGWKNWFDKDSPEEEIIPDGYNDSLDTCRKLLLIRSWCPDRTVFQARKYIADSLEEKYTEPVILNLEKTWEESDTRTPLICFLSMGSDPTNQIDALAKKLKLECRTISMGQGQEVHARKLIQMSMQQGGWVLLQNCHLGLEFMEELLETLIISEVIDESFRVWITTEPHDRFPITLLQSSLKFTNEPPQGVRAGLKRTFAGINQDLLDISNLPMWKPMLYTVAFGVSWSTVRYMIGEVQYGGRVTDDFDKRLLNCFARRAGCHAYKDMSALLVPSLGGVHLSNGGLLWRYQSNTASDVLETITNIQPKESGGGVGETREAIVYRLSEDMLSKLPPDYIPHEVKARLLKMGHLNSMNIFLRQEIDRMQKVITILRNSLSDLKLAIEGTIIMSENLRDALDNMYDARIPQIWKRVSWDSSTLGFWFTELLERNAQFSTWIFEGRPNVFWMTGFFNPQGFLTAMRQEVTRAHKGWALDSVTIHNEVLRQTKEEITSPPGEGVYIYGLYMDGAAWDRRNGKLTESTPKVLFTQLPVLHIFAINSTAPKDPKLYVCPIYKKPRRTDLTFITVVYLRTVLSPDHWILRGVALLCDIK